MRTDDSCIFNDINVTRGINMNLCYVQMSWILVLISYSVYLF